MFRNMFNGASAVNQDIRRWNVSQASNMALMFDYTEFDKCNAMALDTSACPNVAVHDSFEAQKPSEWTYTYTAKTDLPNALAEWTSNATSARVRYGSISDWDVGAVTDMSNLFHNKHSFD